MRSRRTIRLQHYDYRSTGAYFVTICARQRLCLFEDPDVRRILEQVWSAVTPPPSDQFVVMPNHVHGILWLQDTVCSTGIPHPRPLRGIAPGVEAGSLGALVRSFKSGSTKRLNNLRGTPGSPVWQRNYYERVIRNDRELAAVRDYIANNPRKWLEDPNHPDNLRHRRLRAAVGAQQLNGLRTDLR